jgi:hypothetical protein
MLAGSESCRTRIYSSFEVLATSQVLSMCTEQILVRRKPREEAVLEVRG